MLQKHAFAFKWILGVALTLAVIGLLLANPRPVTAPVPLVLTPQDEMSIYQAVIQSIAPLDPAGSRYLLITTDDSAAQPPSIQRDANSRLLSAATQAGIRAALGNVIWIDRREDVPRDPATLRVAQGGVLITLGNLQVQADHQVMISAAYFAGPTWGAGYTFTLHRENGVWSISSKTMNWIS